MKVFKQIIIGLITLVALIFAAQNFEPVQIVFLKSSVELPIAVVVFAIYILGALSGGMLWSLIKRVASMDQSRKKEDSGKSSNEEMNSMNRAKPGFFSDSDEK